MAENILSIIPINILESDIVITDEDNEVFGKIFTKMFEDVKLQSRDSDFKNCLIRCDILLEFVWEKLNTGHWRDVALAWRRAYTQISCIKASTQYVIFRQKYCDKTFYETNLQRNDELIKDVKKILKTCDMGLLMGYSLTNSLLSQYASYVHKMYYNLKQNNVITSNNEYTDIELEPKEKRSRTFTNDSIETVYFPSLEYFQNDIMRKGQPVLMKNCIDNWPALSERKWTVDYIRKVAGGRLVPIEIGSKYTDDSWSQKLLTVEKFINQYIVTDISVKDKGYLAQYQLFNQIADLRKDIIIPDYCAIGSGEYDDENIDINAWFGPAHTVSPLHRDGKENLFCQVFGQKYFKLYDPIYSDKLHIHGDHLLQTTSQIDVENVDCQRFPDFHEIPFTEVTLEAGDMLYIPPMYWHFVKSLSTSFSVTFWWDK